MCCSTRALGPLILAATLLLGGLLANAATPTYGPAPRDAKVVVNQFNFLIYLQKLMDERDNLTRSLDELRNADESLEKVVTDARLNLETVKLNLAQTKTFLAEYMDKVRVKIDEQRAETERSLRDLNQGMATLKQNQTGPGKPEDEYDHDKTERTITSVWICIGLLAAILVLLVGPAICCLATYTRRPSIYSISSKSQRATSSEMLPSRNQAPPSAPYQAFNSDLERSTKRNFLSNLPLMQQTSDMQSLNPR